MSAERRIGFAKHDHRSNTWRRHVHRGFLVLMLLTVSVMQGLSFADHLRGDESTTTLLPDIAVVGALLDPELSQFITNAGRIGTAIEANYPLFPTFSGHLGEFFAYGRNNGSWASSRLADRYPQHRELFMTASQFEDDIRALLGEERPQQYLIILQNTAEKRPNGGFFGSFALVELTAGRVTNFEVLDSYLPAYDNPGTFITGPSRLTNFLPEREIYFIGANKIGFTYHDGAHIKTLYEKSYPGQQIRGVIFVSTDMFKELIPSFRKQLREWQFVNASIDLIRGEDRWGKKELYLDSSKDYFLEHQEFLLKQIVRKLPELIEQRYINIYLENISGGFHTRLREHKLTTRFENDHAYFRDSNISFNKSDTFVDKVIQIVDENGTTVRETTDEIVSLRDLPAGSYEVSIYYQLHVPNSYIDYIHDLEEKYEITLGEREEHILVLDPERSTRGLVYLPPDSLVTNVRGDIYHQDVFNTPFAHTLYFKTKIRENNQVNIVSFRLEIDE